MTHLEGKGVIDYNYNEDILYFYIERFITKGEHKYDYSFDLDGFIIDIDGDGHVIAIELLEASEKLNVPRMVLKFIKGGNFKAKVEKDLILVSFSLTSVIRNKLQQFTLNAERLNTPKLQEAGIECQITPMVQ